MQATPKRRGVDGTIWVQPLPHGEGAWFECEVTHPPSMKGRSVDVFIDAEGVTEMLLELRDVARRARMVRE